MNQGETHTQELTSVVIKDILGTYDQKTMIFWFPQAVLPLSA